MTRKKCSSCGTEVVTGYSEFDCPKCGKIKIIRCESCRGLGIKAECIKCGFDLP